MRSTSATTTHSSPPTTSSRSSLSSRRWRRSGNSGRPLCPNRSPASTAAGGESSTRLELRFPDPSCNPYLASAARLAAGLDGIERRLLPPQPVEEDVYHFDDAKLAKMGIGTLPATLAEALD